MEMGYETLHSSCMDGQIIGFECSVILVQVNWHLNNTKAAQIFSSYSP
jgi:hypothetical protein